MGRLIRRVTETFEVDDDELEADDVENEDAELDDAEGNGAESDAPAARPRPKASRRR
jgi:hypothetical protein